MSDPVARRGWVTRLALESAAVIASILLALALEAWWSDRSLRRQVDEELRGLDQELTHNVEAIDFQLGLMGRINAATVFLLDSMAEYERSPTVLVQDTMFFLVYAVNPTLDFSMGGIDALLASGRLPAVKSPALRLGLAGLRDKVGDAVEEQLLARDIAVNQLVPLIHAAVDVPDFDPLRGTINPLNQASGVGLESYGEVEFPNTREIRNALRTRRGWLQTALLEMATLRGQVEELQDALRAEVAAG